MIVMSGQAAPGTALWNGIPTLQEGGFRGGPASGNAPGLGARVGAGAGATKDSRFCAAA